jgi:hypothetical protein
MTDAHTAREPGDAPLGDDAPPAGDAPPAAVTVGDPMPFVDEPFAGEPVGEPFAPPPDAEGYDWIASLITFGVVAACVIFTLAILDPFRILSDTTPAGGDMGAHVWGPAFMRDHLLPGRLTGWTMDWYAGMPAYQFYMVVPSLAIALLSHLVPYGVAFKVVAVSGVVALPVCCWFLGRSGKLPFPGPALLAVGGMLYLFDRSFSIYGGNIPSTLAGEFSFSIALALGILYLGVLLRGFDTGRHRGWAALLLALTGLCHLIPVIFVGVCTLLYLVVRPGRGQVRYLLTMLPVGGALMVWWMVPFFGRSGYMTDMGWERIDGRDRYINYLWSRDTLDPQLVNSPDLRWVIAVAAVGLLLSIVNRRRTGVFLALVAVTFAAGFVLAPQGRLWNARLLPFYYLALYLLAAVGVAEMGRLLAMLFAPDITRPIRAIRWATPVVGVLGALLLLGMSLNVMPLGRFDETGAYRWGIGALSLSTTDRSFIDSWAAWNFEGYEGDPRESETSAQLQYRKSYPEYHDLMATMGQLGQQRGCGRAMWEHEEQHDRYGTPMALMLLPFWTDGCIGSMEGLYFESSGTTPYQFLDQDELSWVPSNAERKMPYDAGPPTRSEFDRGVRHLQMMGVKYYMAVEGNTQALAAGNRSLQPVATSGPWHVYEVADAPVVQALANQPAVLTGQPTTGEPWQDVAVCWWHTPDSWDVVLTADGPPDWQRVSRTHEPEAGATPSEECQPKDDWGWFAEGGGPEARPQPPVAVTNVAVTEDGVSFDVDRPGVPVMVKVSYFPNWKVSGAQGPFRATPNFMVVVPDGNHVELHYGWTALDIGAYLISLVGIAGLVVLFRAPPVRMRPPGPYWGQAERPDLYPPGPPPGAPFDEMVWATGPDTVPWPAPSDDPAHTADPLLEPRSPGEGPGRSSFAPPDGWSAAPDGPDWPEGPTGTPPPGEGDGEGATSAATPRPPDGADTVSPMGEHPHASSTIDPPSPPAPDASPGPEPPGP